jgi:hypothetical protein
MKQSLYNDPYAGNILVEPLGPIPSAEDALQALTYLPDVPPVSAMGDFAKHVRLHYAAAVRELHIPTLESTRIACSVDLILRQGYHYRDVRLPQTWQMVMGEMTSVAGPPRLQHVAPAMAVLVEGNSGVGKTQLILRWLHRYPQTVVHPSFPKFANGLKQLVWLSIQVPETGSSIDCARRLMQASDEAMEGNRFVEVLARKRPQTGPIGLAEWLQFAHAHFLGVLHLDEVQNLFKLPTLEERRRSKRDASARELSVQDDKMLKWILGLASSGISLVISGTPDGVSALQKRLSTAQRICTGGYHRLSRFEDPRAKGYRKIFLGQLCRYQLVKKPLPLDDALAELVLDQTAGIPRMIIALWLAAHRIALERRDADELRLTDFERAASTYLAPVHEALEALKSGDPHRMAAYEDLLPTGDWFQEALTP